MTYYILSENCSNIFLSVFLDFFHLSPVLILFEGAEKRSQKISLVGCNVVGWAGEYPVSDPNNMLLQNSTFLTMLPLETKKSFVLIGESAIDRPYLCLLLLLDRSGRMCSRLRMDRTSKQVPPPETRAKAATAREREDTASRGEDCMRRSEPHPIYP